MPHVSNHRKCTYKDFSNLAKTIVAPAYKGVKGGALKPYHSTYLKYFLNNFSKWLDNMWGSYNSGGCETFKSRYMYWDNKLTGISPITNEHQIAITKAHMEWVLKIHGQCGCAGSISDVENNTATPPPPPPLETPPPSPLPTRRQAPPPSTPPPQPRINPGSGSGY